MAIKRWVGLGKETEWGTSVIATRFLRAQESIISDPGWYTPPPIIRRAPSVKEAVKYLAQGNIGEFDARPDTIGEMLYMAFGKVETGAPVGTAYKHTFTPEDNIPHYTFMALTELKIRVIPTILMQRLTFRFGQGLECLKVLASVVGRGPEGDAAPDTVEPTDSDFSSEHTFSLDQLTGFKVDTVDRLAYLFDGEINFENPLPIEKMREGGSQYLGSLRLSDRRVTGKLSLAFEDTNERAKFLNRTSFDLWFQWKGAQIGATGHYKTFETFLYNCSFMKDTSPHVKPINEPLVLNAPFQAFYDSGEGMEAKATLENEETSY